MFNDAGFIIQARIGSTRLPGKALRAFYKEKSILDIIVEKLQVNFNLPVIIAKTSSNQEDNEIEFFARRKKIKIFRGEEEKCVKTIYRYGR